jgi:hypothetical protein
MAFLSYNPGVPGDLTPVARPVSMSQETLVEEPEAEKSRQWREPSEK